MASGSGRSSASASRRLPVIRSGMNASRGQTRSTSVVIDKRDADFEPVGHGHDIEVAKQLRSQVQAAFETRDRGRRPLGPGR